MSGSTQLIVMDILDYQTKLEVSSSGSTCTNVVPMARRNETVEGKLWMTLCLLAATEGNIHLFSTLKRKNLSTNDVSSFLSKQTIHKRVNSCVDVKVRKAAMHSKLVDALAYAKRLRQQRNSLKKQVLKKYLNKRIAKHELQAKLNVKEMGSSTLAPPYVMSGICTS